MDQQIAQIPQIPQIAPITVTPGQGALCLARNAGAGADDLHWRICSRVREPENGHTYKAGISIGMLYIRKFNMA